MSWSVKLAKSILKDKTLHRHHFIQVICQIAIALCITTILISSFLIRGFESKIEEKIFGFWSHIRVTSLENGSSQWNEVPSPIDTSGLRLIGVKKITPVVNKGVILKYKSNIEGIVLKGVSLSNMPFKEPKNLDYQPLSEIPIILSEQTVNKLNIKLGSTFFVNIIDSTPQTIKAKLVNTYFTNIEEFDNQVAYTDISQLQRINQWNDSDYSWVEVEVDDKNQISSIANKLYKTSTDINVDTIYTLFPQMFDWLALMKRNELIILIVMLIVAMVNIISTISIFVIEKTKLIGMLKVLGARNNELYAMMYYQVMRIIISGILIGNILTGVITAVMYIFKPIRLDPQIYYIEYAPIQFELTPWIIINILSIVVCLVSAWIPLYTISKISPVKVVEYQ